MSLKEFFRDWNDATRNLSDSEKGRLASAIIAESIGSSKVAITGNEKYVYPLYKARLEQEKNGQGRNV